MFLHKGKMVILILENRLLYICETEIMPTVKEFDIFALLIKNPRRILTDNMIINLVWHENLDYYSRRSIYNPVSNLRHNATERNEDIRISVDTSILFSAWIYPRSQRPHRQNLTWMPPTSKKKQMRQRAAFCLICFSSVSFKYRTRSATERYHYVIAKNIGQASPSPLFPHKDRSRCRNRQFSVFQLIIAAVLIQHLAKLSVISKSGRLTGRINNHQ